jgi:hypothetical protein
MIPNPFEGLFDEKKDPNVEPVYYTNNVIDPTINSSINNSN